MKTVILTTAAAVCFALPALACQLEAHDPYARASHMMAQSGAAFMELRNTGSSDCHVTSARSDIAERVELHTHIEDDQGVMRMVEVKEGFVIPAGESHMLARGGDHVMFLGLRQAMHQGDQVAVTLVLADGEALELTVPVDMERMPDHGASHSHSHSHSHD
ncbi:MAG: copper chaperone PCu(A)C [Rhodobacteraceae bacterium]|nr:copper chaperone PCu(A)C [Paracoccaceae bacterium]